MSIEYENAQQLAREYPNTFEAPSTEELARIGPGDLVKVCAKGTPGEVSAERFWVLVHRVEGDTIAGEVNSHVICHPLKAGDVITLKPENVYNLMRSLPKH